MKFKTLLSPTQSFSFAGNKRQAHLGIFETSDQAEIEYLEGNPAWEKVEPKGIKEKIKNFGKSEVKKNEEIMTKALKDTEEIKEKKDDKGYKL